MVPVLTSIFLLQGVPVENVVHLALGTSMASMIVISFSSFRAHQSKEAVIWKVAVGIASGSIVGAFAATFLAAYLQSAYLAIFFALFMAFVSLQMFLDRKPHPGRKLAGKNRLICRRLWYRRNFSTGLDRRRINNCPLPYLAKCRYQKSHWHISRYWPTYFYRGYLGLFDQWLELYFGKQLHLWLRIPACCNPYLG